jgi:hypothetical protein
MSEEMFGQLSDIPKIEPEGVRNARSERRAGGCGIRDVKAAPAFKTLLGVLPIRCLEVTDNRRRGPKFAVDCKPCGSRGRDKTTEAGGELAIRLSPPLFRSHDVRSLAQSRPVPKTPTLPSLTRSGNYSGFSGRASPDQYHD